MELQDYHKTYTVKDEHIDVQDIMDGLYYPFYMEDCRHAFIKDTLGFDLEEQARQGVNMVLSKYTISFFRSLRRGDEFTVTCELYKDPTDQPKLHMVQHILKNGKKYTTGVFTGTCVKSTGGRPFLPDGLGELLKDAPVLEGE